MSFKDIFKQAFLDGFSNGINAKQIVITLVLACVLGAYIFLVYRIVTRKTFYSLSFNLSLVAMAIITSAIMLTIQSNIAMSLGMCGALSIVRFRTAVKDPMDLVFLYWAISIGIICGAGLTLIAVALSLIITVIILILQKYPLKKLSMILVINSDNLENDKEILELVRKHSKNYQLKSKNVTPKSMNMIIEVKVPNESDIVKEISALEGITSVSLMSHDGEITA